MSPATSIAHYRIAEKIGEGGMGAVYRATDTKLNRDVAIKVIPDSFAQDADRMARFAREAQVLASLNHPNIAAIYGVEERALVLELVEGPTLADVMNAGPLPPEEALPIARQIAEALEYAHEKGIVHRDLKPANIKVTPSGQAKVLDFGLAKALLEELPVGDPRVSPTMTIRGTVAGAIMGTAAYMSPEQAKGKRVDQRSDIWSFGVVLAEMLTGKPFYSGETVAEMMASVIFKEPDLSGLPAGTPASVRMLLRRCLEKDPRRRLQAIGEARIILESPGTDAEPLVSATSLARRRGVPVWTLIAAALAALTLGIGWWRAARPVERPALQFTADLGPDAVRGRSITAAISPDGNRIVYLTRAGAGTILTTRLLSESKSAGLAGTENGGAAFFSPDGNWIAFFDASKLKKVSVHGGAAVTICDAVNGRGGSWGDDDKIVASLDGVKLYTVPAAGGTPTMLADPQASGMKQFRFPQVLPGSETAIFTAAKVDDVRYAGYETASIAQVSLKSGAIKVLHEGGYFGRYLPTGHLVYASQGTLFAMPFDLARSKSKGPPIPVFDELAANPAQGGGQFDISSTGTAVLFKGKPVSLARPIGWLDTDGNIEVIKDAIGSTVKLSPDGSLLALVTDAGISIHDIERGITSRLTFQPASDPVWTADSKYVIYLSPKGALYMSRADGSNSPVEFERPVGVRSFDLPTAGAPTSISADSRHLILHVGGKATNRDLYIAPVDLTDPSHPKIWKPTAFVQDPGPDVDGVISPDGRWVAYTGSSESGTGQVYVRPFPGGAYGGKWQVSPSRGRSPVWARDGRKLFYTNADGQVMVVEYSTQGQSFLPRAPRIWSPTALISIAGLNSSFGVHPDGKRVVGNLKTESTEEVHATFVLNFFDELRRRAP